MDDGIRNRPTATTEDERTNGRLAEPLDESASASLECLLQANAKLGDLELVPDGPRSAPPAPGDEPMEERRPRLTEAIGVRSGAAAGGDDDRLEVAKGDELLEAGVHGLDGSEAAEPSEVEPANVLAGKTAMGADRF